MAEFGIDYSFAHPDPAAIAAAGATFVVRYTTGSKAITHAEAQALHAHGLGIALVRETAIDRVLTSGIGGGANDAAAERAFADELGYPTDCPIFYACDTTPNYAAAMRYFQGVRQVATTRPVGWYGGMQVGLGLKAAGLVDLVWVANAASWSGYRHFDELAPVARANAGVAMLQSTARTLPGLDPSSYDLDEFVHPFTVWGRAVVPPKPPKPTPPVIGPTVYAGDVNVHLTPITSIHLDTHGDGVVDVPDIASEHVFAVLVEGGSDPLDPKVKRYDKTPIARMIRPSNPARIVLTGGEPGGTYALTVASA